MKRQRITAFLSVCMMAVMTGCGDGAEKDAVPAAAVQSTAEEQTVENGGTVPEETGAQTEAAQEETQPQDAQKEKREPVKVRGIYVTGPIAGDSRMEELIQLVEETELNALVIDIKNDEGFVTYRMQSDTVQEIGSAVNYIRDMEALVRTCKEKDIYLIGRIVSFKDPYLAEKKPEWSVKTQTGEIFRDKAGLAWVNPYNRQVWDYLLEVAEQAAEIGFDEIQFDYIRFSTDLKADRLDFGEEADAVGKTEIITEFTEYAYEALSPLGVYVSADVYGTVIDNPVDRKIVGQDYAQMAGHLDYICPMIYPSHYGPGAYGIAVPDAQPYDTILAALQASQRTLAQADPSGQESTSAGQESVSGNTPEAVPAADRPAQCAVVRPWLQNFTATWVDGHISYQAAAIRDQIEAVYDAGYEEWILWNASVRYQPDSLLSVEEAAAEESSRAEEAARLEEESRQAEEAARLEEESRQAEEAAELEESSRAEEAAGLEESEQEEAAQTAETGTQTETAAE